MKKIMYYVIGLILFAGFIILYARWFEWNNIYFPRKYIDTTPAETGLAYEDVYFQTPDEVKLNGWFIPAGAEARATVILAHGNAGNISHRMEIIQVLHGLGLNVFIFDYRGYGRSEGRASENGTYLDALGAHEYLLSRDDIDREKIIAYGRSLGGSVMIDLAGNVRVYALISDSAFTSIGDMAKELYPFLPVQKLLTIKYDSLSKIDKLDMPKLIIHSEEDEVVPFSHGRRLYEKAAPPKKFYRMKGGHNDAVYLYGDKLKQGIDEFLREDCGI